AARQADGRQLSPTLITDRAAVDALGAEAGDFLCHIVAHEIDLMLAVGFRGMDRELGRRCCEDQPAAAGVSERETEYVAKERSIRLGIAAVDDSVHSGDHGALSALR